ncbi:hypothetical protein [Calorimonas adulescens]|uniref:Uncharacterized protein n=1 Tax=Calorimonas adulescens TaxID=2606906 RepID=A0A5D8QA53_9THEO|nr:hypothetical protein [Calorimonas adulescens]TZE81009.1 hypothetical protein FWJ32_10920 [Calorimonas adulescens]
MARPLLVIYMIAVMVIVVEELCRQDRVLGATFYNKNKLLFDLRYRNISEDRNLLMIYTAGTVLFAMFMYLMGYGLSDFLLLFVSYAVILLYLAYKRDIILVYRERLIHLGSTVQMFDFDIYNTYRISYDEKALYLYTEDPLEKPVRIPVDVKTEVLVELNDILSPYIRQMVKK